MKGDSRSRSRPIHKLTIRLFVSSDWEDAGNEKIIYDLLYRKAQDALEETGRRLISGPYISFWKDDENKEITWYLRGGTIYVGRKQCLKYPLPDCQMPNNQGFAGGPRTGLLPSAFESKVVV